MTSSYGIFPTAFQMPPLIDDSELAKPLTLKLDEPASIVVRISGFPKPTVRWQVGRKRVKESPRFHMFTDGDRSHILEISRVTRDLEQGVWVVATNVNGEDCSLVEVRTYEIVLKPRQSKRERQPRMLSRGGSLQRLGSFSNSAVPVKRGGSILSLKEWKLEMAIRNKMRSVDDLAFSADKASLMSGLGYSLSVDVGDSDDPDLDEQFHILSRHRSKRPMPATTPRLVFPEVEPSRLVPVPNRSTTNVSMLEDESIEDNNNNNTTHPAEQTADECAKQTSKQKKRKPKKNAKKSTSTPDPSSTLETTQIEVEDLIPDDQNSSDLPGAHVTSDEDVWMVQGGEKLSDLCQKMLQMFPESKMQTVGLKNIPIQGKIEAGEIVDRSMRKLKGSVRKKMLSKAAKGGDTQAKEDKKEMAKDKLKVQNPRLLPTEEDNIKSDDELLVNKSAVNKRKHKTAQAMPINKGSDEITAQIEPDVQKEQSNSSDERDRRLPKKSYSLSHPLNSEIKSQEPISVSNVVSQKMIRKGSAKTRRSKRKSRSKSMTEIRQEMTVYEAQEIQTDAEGNRQREEDNDKSQSIANVCEESVEVTTRQGLKRTKKGKRRSLELTARETQTQKNAKAPKKAQSERKKPGRVEARTVEHNDNDRTLEENEAFIAIKAFAEIEARTSEQVEHETSKSQTESKKTSVRAKRKAKASTEDESEISSKMENLDVEHETKTHKKTPKTSGKVNRLSKREQNKTIASRVFSLSAENVLLDRINCEKTSSSAASDSLEANDVAIKEIVSDSRGRTVASTDIDNEYKVNLKLVANGKKKKQKASYNEKVILKTDEVNSKKREDREDMNNNEDLEHYQEGIRDSNNLENSEDPQDSEVFPEVEIIVQMDREPRSGVRRRQDGTNETVNEVSERARKKRKENFADTAKNVNKENKSGQVGKKVENKLTSDTTDGHILLEKKKKEDEEEFEEQIIAMDREPRGGTARNRNAESFSAVDGTDKERSAGIVGNSINPASSQRRSRQNSRPSTNTVQDAMETIKKSNTSKKGSPEIIHENVQQQEVGSKVYAVGNGEKSLFGNHISVLTAEKTTEHRITESSSESINPINNSGPESRSATKSNLKYTTASNGRMETTLGIDVHQHMGNSNVPVRQVSNTENHVEDAKTRTKKSRWRNSQKAVESISSDEGNKEFLRSANSPGNPSTASDEQEVTAQNAQHEMMRELEGLRLNASPQIEIEPKDPKLRAVKSEKEIKTPDPLNSLADLNKNTESRIEKSENDVQTSSNITLDNVQHRPPEVISSLASNNVRDDEEKTENKMTNEQTLILQALAERIRSGQVEIIIVNKLSLEDGKTHPASGSRTQPVPAADHTKLSNACETSTKVNASKPPMLLITEEQEEKEEDEAALPTKLNEIKFIDSDDSADILEKRDQEFKLTEDTKTVSNEKRIDLSATTLELQENRTVLHGHTTGTRKTKLDLPAAKANLSENKIELLATRTDLPLTKVNLPKAKVNLSETQVDLLDSNLDLHETKVNVYTDRQKSQIQNGQHSGTLPHSRGTLLPDTSFIRKDFDSNSTSERNSTPAAIPSTNNTNDNIMKVTASLAAVQSNRKTETKNNQKETEIGALPMTTSYSGDTGKSSSVEFRDLKKIEPPKPKPRTSVSDGKSEIVRQNSTQPTAFGTTIIQTQSKQTVQDTKSNTEGLHEVKTPNWNIKLTPKANFQIQQKQATAELNDAIKLEGKLGHQIQPQPTPRTKPSITPYGSEAHLSNHMSRDPPVLENKSSPIQWESSRISHLQPNPWEKEAHLKVPSPVREMQVKLDEFASPKTSTFNTFNDVIHSSVVTQETTTSGNDSSISLLSTTPVEKSSKTTQVATGPIQMSSMPTQVTTGPIQMSSMPTRVATGPIQMSSMATQTATMPVEKSSTATQISPVSDQNSSMLLLAQSLPTSNTLFSSNSTSNVAPNSRPMIGNHFAVASIDHNTFGLGHRYTPLSRNSEYRSSFPNSWWNVYQRKFSPDYVRENGLIRHQISMLDVHTRTSGKRNELQQIHTTAPYWTPNGSVQVSNSSLNTQVNISAGNRDVTNDPTILHQSQHSTEKEISESGQNSVNVKPETSALMSRQFPLTSSSNYSVDKSSMDGCVAIAGTNDAPLSREQYNSPISDRTVKDIVDSFVSTRTDEVEMEGFGLKTGSHNEKETVQYESSTETDKKDFVSRVVTHEYGEVIVLYPAT